MYSTHEIQIHSGENYQEKQKPVPIANTPDGYAKVSTNRKRDLAEVPLVGAMLGG